MVPLTNKGDCNNNVKEECHKFDSLQVEDEGSDDSTNDHTQIEVQENDENPRDLSDKKKMEDLDLEDLMEVEDS